MRTLSFLVPLLALISVPGHARAVDLSAPIACGISDVFDCSATGCIGVEADAVGVPDLMRLDPDSKTLTALDTELERAASMLESLSLENGKIAARTHDGDRTLVLVIDEKTGEAMLTVTDLHLALVAYGACAKF